MNKKKLINIYAYLNLITGKYVYVGQTVNSLKKRADSNGYDYRKKSKYFGLEIEKYGWNNFRGEILTTTTDPEYANLLEWFYTIELDTQYPNGCNDNIGRKRSERYKKEESENRKGENNPMFGRLHSEETKQKMREAWLKRTYKRKTVTN